MCERIKREYKLDVDYTFDLDILSNYASAWLSWGSALRHNKLLPLSSDSYHGCVQLLWHNSTLLHLSFTSPRHRNCSYRNMMSLPVCLPNNVSAPVLLPSKSRIHHLSAPIHCFSSCACPPLDMLHSHSRGSSFTTPASALATVHAHG